MTTTATLPTLADQARAIAAGTRRPAVTGIPTEPVGWECYLVPSCEPFMDCDCPPYQGINQRHLSQPAARTTSRGRWLGH
jgi:hypothetical protein